MSTTDGTEKVVASCCRHEMIFFPMFFELVFLLAIIYLLLYSCLHARLIDLYEFSMVD